MRYLRLGDPGEEVPVARIDGNHYDLRSLTPDINGTFLANGPETMNRHIQQALDDGKLNTIEHVEGIRVGSPIARPTAVICIGQNYAAHAAESGSAPPEVPIVFFKHPNTVVGPFDDVLIPPGAITVDWEVELGIVIGKRARYLRSPEAAENHIAGFVTSNDVSERTYQLDHSGGQWSKGKCAESFNPIGPELVTPEEVEWNNLRLWSQVNGEARQNSSTSDMIFDAVQIIHHLSHYMVLEPGDLINTGTPEGVGISGKFPYLSSGDVMEIGIEGLGAAQRQHLRNASPVDGQDGDHS